MRENVACFQSIINIFKNIKKVLPFESVSVKITLINPFDLLIKRERMSRYRKWWLYGMMSFQREGQIADG